MHYEGIIRKRRSVKDEIAYEVQMYVYPLNIAELLSAGWWVKEICLQIERRLRIISKEFQLRRRRGKIPQLMLAL